MKIEITITGKHGREYRHQWPAMFQVCDDCAGHGTHLTPSIREHAYSAEEFAEAFDDEERAEYFRHGGRYDVRCSTCKGERLVLTVERDAVEAMRHGSKLLALWDESEAYRYEQIDADRYTREQERRMGC